ncbi:CHAD domain-containing protein [Filimonas effusa]|uniref:CHAD domain-containing protein n=1 Tax=Filimonas effusa TaxID=2508721 RepID=A0A4Q1DA32_9BACT|nr:CHAD domain-containing protein [Filimonas effusa]RXK85605.1 CHAD domain-containing protein [Filimonas effusa]
MPSPLQKYFAQRVKNLFNHLHDFDVSAEEGALHDLRVELKKLRAVIKFLQQVYSKQKLKKPAHLLRTIFQQAGEIREYQLLQQWLRKYHLKVLEERYFPAERLHEMNADFRKQAPAFKNDLKEIIELSGRFVAHTNGILAEQYFADLHAQLQEKTSADLPSREWHDLRKLIKQWMYALNWVVPEEVGAKESVLAYFNKLQEQIGQWHDLEMVKEAFSQKQIYLSQDMEVQKDFALAWEKLTHSLKYRERQVVEMLAAQQVVS